MTATSITFSFIHGIFSISNFFRQSITQILMIQGREETYTPSKNAENTQQEYGECVLKSKN